MGEISEDLNNIEQCTVASRTGCICVRNGELRLSRGHSVSETRLAVYSTINPFELIEFPTLFNLTSPFPF